MFTRVNRGWTWICYQLNHYRSYRGIPYSGKMICSIALAFHVFALTNGTQKQIFRPRKLKKALPKAIKQLKNRGN